MIFAKIKQNQLGLIMAVPCFASPAELAKKIRTGHTITGLAHNSAHTVDPFFAEFKYFNVFECLK